MSKIAIITRLGNAQAHMVLAGSYGTMRQEGEKNVFLVDPSMKSVSSVYEHLSDQLIGGGDKFEEVDVPDVIADTFKIQLLNSLKTRWAILYKNVGSQNQQSPMLNSMIQAEALRVSSAVEAHFVSRGIVSWDIPVTAKMNAEGVFHSNEEIIAGLTNPTDVLIDSTRSAVRSIAAPLLETTTQSDQAEDTPVEGMYQHLETEVKGHISVMANSAENAADIAQFILALNLTRATEGLPDVVNFQLTPTEITSSEETAAEAADEGDDDQDSDQEWETD